MNDLRFNYVAARNFMPFGPDGFELHLNKLGNIVLVKGENRDRLAAIRAGGWDQDDGPDPSMCRNGCGKSTLPEIIVYTLYGQTIKRREKLGQEDVINNKVGKKLRTEVHFDKYKVVRCRKPNSLRLWEHPDGKFASDDDETFNEQYEKTLGTMAGTQAEIERHVGLSYEAFVNIVVFTDNNSGSFLECDGPTKREIVENLLSLGVYREYAERAKVSRNKQKEVIGRLAIDYDRLLSEAGRANQRVEQVAQQDSAWRAKVTSEVKSLEFQSDKVRNALSNSNGGIESVAYNDAQREIAKLAGDIESFQANSQKAADMMRVAEERRSAAQASRDEASKQYNAIWSSHDRLKSELAAELKVLQSFESLEPGVTCAKCHGTVSAENYQAMADASRQRVDELKAQEATQSAKREKSLVAYNGQEAEAKKADAVIAAVSAKIREISSKVASSQKRIAELSTIRPPSDADVQVRLWTEEVNRLESSISAKKVELKGSGPFAEIAAQAKADAVERAAMATTRKDELATAEEDLPYYEFYVKAFGDSGIRKFVIDGIIPTLNARVAHWMQTLIGGTLGLTFDNRLEEKVETVPPDGNPFVYFALSGGERRRLNLAVSAAFAHLTMLNWGFSPSVVFLDEVTTNIDPQGVQGVYDMIRELSKNRQVFVTTHDQGLSAMLEGCPSIDLIREGGFTRLAGASS